MRNTRPENSAGNDLAGSGLPGFPKTGSQPRLKVLVLDEWLPFPPDSGKRSRTWNLMRRLAVQHDITLLCYGNEGCAAEAVRQAGIRVRLVEPEKAPAAWRLYARLLANSLSGEPYSVAKHYTERFEESLRDLVCADRFDVIHCEWTPYAAFLRAAGETPAFVMAHNVESQILERRSAHAKGRVGRLFFRLQADKMRRFEHQALRSAAGVAAVTPQDARVMESWGVKHVALAENGVDLSYFEPHSECADGCRVLLLGSLDWYPNLDALEYFVADILPKLQMRIPDVTLQVVGRNPGDGLGKRFGSGSGVELVGDVADVRPYLAHADVVAVPLRIGGGSRIKILEALAMKRAVVSTSIGAEGLAVRDEVHLVLADTPVEFARRTAELLVAPQMRKRLGEAGRSLIEARYSWERAATALDTAWRLTAARPGNRAEERTAAREMEVAVAP